MLNGLNGVIKEWNREVYRAREVKIQKLVENTTNEVDLQYEDRGISIVEVENQKSLFKHCGSFLKAKTQ